MEDYLQTKTKTKRSKVSQFLDVNVPLATQGHLGDVNKEKGEQDDEEEEEEDGDDVESDEEEEEDNEEKEEDGDDDDDDEKWKS